MTALRLLLRKQGTRLVVRTPDERAAGSQPDLDDLINQTIRVARRHGYTIHELSQRVSDRLAEEPPDHILVLSIDPGMCRMLQAEIQSAVKYRVTTCTPEELIASPEPALGALVVSPPGVLPMIAEVLPKDRPPITVLYSSAEAHFEVVRKMTHPSVVAIVSISETFLKIACGLLGPRIGTRHTLIECLVDERKNARIPAADLLFCDAVTFPRVHAHRRAKNAIPYNLISSECLEQIVAMMPVQKKSTLKSAD